MNPDATSHSDTPRELPDDGRLDLFSTGSSLLRWIAVVLVVVLVAEVAARTVTARSAEEVRWYDAAAQQRIELLDERGDAVEVAFAGTSAAWQAFVPAEFEGATGRSSINVGLAGAIPTVTGPWLADEVAPRSSPDLVVWGLTPLDFAPEYGDQQDEAYRSAVATADGWLAGLDRLVSSTSTLVASRRLLRSPSDLFGSGEEQRASELAAAAATTGPDGERVDFDENFGPEEIAIQRSRLSNYAIDQRDVDAIVAAISQLQANGSTVVLVEVPVPDRFVQQLPRPEDDMAATQAAIIEIGASTSSDVVLMGDVFGDTNFVDSIHLNAEAASTTTRWLAHILDAVQVDEFDGGCGFVDVADDIGFITAVGVCRNDASS